MAINIYKGTVTAGETDGDLVSCGDYTDPIHFGIDAQIIGDESIATLAVRCDADLRTHGECKIYDSNDLNDRYQLSINGTSWADEITFPQVEDTNQIFYAKSRVIGSEYAHLDRTVKFCIDCEIERA